MALRSVLLLLVFALTGAGCAANKGDALARDFEEWHAAHPITGTRVVELKKYNTFLFTGNMTIVLELTGDYSAASVRRVSAEVCKFRENARGEVHVNLVTGPATVLLPCQAGPLADTVALLDGVDGLNGLVSLSQIEYEQPVQVAFDDLGTAVAGAPAVMRAVEGMETERPTGAPMEVNITGGGLQWHGSGLMEREGLAAAEVVTVVGAEPRTLEVGPESVVAVVDTTPQRARRLERRVRQRASGLGNGVTVAPPGLLVRTGLSEEQRDLADELLAIPGLNQVGPGDTSWTITGSPEAGWRAYQRLGEAPVTADLPTVFMTLDLGEGPGSVPGTDPGAEVRPQCQFTARLRRPDEFRRPVSVCQVPGVTEFSYRDGQVLVGTAEPVTELVAALRTARYSDVQLSRTKPTYARVAFKVEGAEPVFDENSDPALKKEVLAAWG